MSLGNREGKTCEETEPEELPEEVNGSVLRVTGGYKGMSAPFCNFAGRRFSCRKTQIPQHMAFNRRCMRNSDSSAAKVRK